MTNALRPQILILYTELAGYTMASLHALVKDYSCTVHLVRWPVKAEAPFQFKNLDQIKVYERKDLNGQALQKLAEHINPDILLCAGWIDKEYLRLCEKWKKKIPVVLTMDNKWKGSFRQIVASIFSRFTIQRYFNNCWVPGPQQMEFALKLGFAEGQIRKGFYSCDLEKFNSVYLNQKIAKKERFPHVFIYAGRYLDFKGVRELWTAFAQFQQETKSDWKLVCLGNGTIAPVEHPSILHLGFVQPEEMGSVMQGAGVYILPSLIEPWGVAVQEFAAAGFPLLLSSNVGAGVVFLEDELNGIRFEAGSAVSMLDAMKKIAGKSDAELFRMGAESHRLAQQISPQTWAQTLMEFIPNS